MVKSKRYVHPLKMLAFIFLITLMLLVISTPLAKAVIETALERFKYGFTSEGRDEELALGWTLFKRHKFWGVGWGQIPYIDYLHQKTFYYNHSMYVAILARGGLFLGIPALITFVSIIKNNIKYKCPIITTLVLAEFFILAYGNAGIFNYTISSFMIVIMWHITNSSSQKKYKTKIKKVER